MSLNTKILAACAVALLGPSLAVAGTWPRFRGPNGQGIGAAKTIPVQWTDADYTWKLELLGSGLSSPVVWNDRLFVTSANADQAEGFLQAIEPATGKVRWQKTYRLVKSKMSRLNSYATGTPALTADRVYVMWCTAAQTTLVALDHDGQEVFRKDFGPTVSSHGPGISPMVVDDLVVFAHEQRKEETGYWIAVDRETGETRWRIERDHEQTSYSTPCLTEAGAMPRHLVFASLSHGLAGVAPANGAILWSVPDALPARVVSSPVLADKHVIGACGRGGGGVQLTVVELPTTRAALPKVAWTLEKAGITPYVPTSLYKDGLLYTFHDQGTVACLDVKTGKQHWSEKPAGRFYGSPVWVDGRLYCITREGQCVVLQAGTTYACLAVNDLGEASDATPAIADERMYLRTSSQVLCLSGRAP